MEEDKRKGDPEENTTVDRLLTIESNESDWFTKISKIERAKAVRRATREARKKNGKPITFSGAGGWSQIG